MGIEEFNKLIRQISSLRDPNARMKKARELNAAEILPFLHGLAERYDPNQVLRFFLELIAAIAGITEARVYMPNSAKDMLFCRSVLAKGRKACERKRYYALRFYCGRESRVLESFISKIVIIDSDSTHPGKPYGHRAKEFGILSSIKIPIMFDVHHESLGVICLDNYLNTKDSSQIAEDNDVRIVEIQNLIRACYVLLNSLKDQSNKLSIDQYMMAVLTLSKVKKEKGEHNEIPALQRMVQAVKNVIMPIDLILLHRFIGKSRKKCIVSSLDDPPMFEECIIDVSDRASMTSGEYDEPIIRSIGSVNCVLAPEEKKLIGGIGGRYYIVLPLYIDNPETIRNNLLIEASLIFVMRDSEPLNLEEKTLIALLSSFVMRTLHNNYLEKVNDSRKTLYRLMDELLCVQDFKNPNPQGFFNGLCSILLRTLVDEKRQQYGHSDNCALVAFDEERDLYRIVGYATHNAKTLDSRTEMPFPLGFVWQLKAKKIRDIIIPDLNEYPYNETFYKFFDDVNSAIMSCMGDWNLIISVEASGMDFFSNEDLELLKHLSQPVRLAFELFNQIEKAKKLFFNEHISVFRENNIHHIKEKLALAHSEIRDFYNDAAPDSIEPTVDVVLNKVDRALDTVVSYIAHLLTDNEILNYDIFSIDDFLRDLLDERNPSYIFRDIPFLNGERVEVDSNIPNGPFNVFFSRNSFRSVLLSILSNSLIALKKTQNKKIEIRLTNEKGNQIQVTIRDNGIGIDKKEWNNIFKPEFTKWPDGFTDGQTGLGLDKAKRLVEFSGGSIGVLDSDGKSFTEIFILFPIAHSEENSIMKQ